MTRTGEQKGKSETQGAAHAALSRKLLLISVVLGVLGAGLLALYLDRFEREVSGGAPVQLLTVIKPAESGALLSDDMLSVVEIPRAYVERRAVRASDRQKVLGIRVDRALEPQDVLLWSDLALSTDDRDLSSLVQPGKRAITVRASESGSDPAGNGLLRPGDYVDVIVTLQDEHGGAPQAVVLLQRILVLAVGSKTQPQGFAKHDDSGSRGYGQERELTLSLRVEEAQLLSLARERGTLSVALRGPSDSKVIENLADMSASSLYDKAARESVQRRRETSQPAPIRLSENVP